MIAHIPLREFKKNVNNPKYESFLAITSYFLMSNLTEVIPGGTGTAMLFSAGTFLYVATVHVLPEVGKLDKKKLFLMVSMSVMPLLLSLGHSH